MNDISSLLALLGRVVEGAEVSDEEVQSVIWSSDDLILKRVANDSWLALRRFVDDKDIRTRDAEYSCSLRLGLRAYLDELIALDRGEDPYRRRLSWPRRMLWRFGLAR